jgi:ADP-ribosylglycohydrolase
VIGAIAGDIIGSRFEHRNIKTTEFELFTPGSVFTDDTVLTVATADALLADGDYARAYRTWFRRYPRAGYGGYFRNWGWSTDAGPYNSFGNGSAMRVSPVGWAFDDREAVLAAAQSSAHVTHNHAEGIRGAQAVALAVFLARSGADKDHIRRDIEQFCGYDLQRTVDEIRPGYTFDVTCQGSVPEAIIAFLDAEDFEDTVRKAVSMGGDSDTIACIAGSIAEAYYGGVPTPIRNAVFTRLEPDLIDVIEAFPLRWLV